MSTDIFIGTSGFYYKDWLKLFYPPEIKKDKLLNFYAQYFKTVEINASFYRIPTVKAVENWRKKTGENFIFSFKASRIVTHLKKLAVDKEIIDKVFNPLNILKSNPPKHLVLFQTPVFLKMDPNKLIVLLKLLPQGFLYAFEFRNPSWFHNEIYEILKKFNAALTLSDSPVTEGKRLWPLADENTANFSYIRFHGSQKLCASSYTNEELKHYANLVKQKIAKGMKVFAYFNNDVFGYAIEDARRLKEILKV